jgi:lysophospholipase L1-like esterase
MARERFLSLGDSFTIGTGTSPDRSFPAVLVRLWREAGHDVALSNPAVNGYATDDLIADELPLIARIRPTLVSVLIGANDIVRGLAADRYRERLGLVHSRIRSDAPDARVVALPQPDWSLSPAAASFGDPSAIARTIERFNDIAREQAEHAGARWIDLFPLMREQAKRRLFAADGLHPSASAYAEWSRELARAWVL